MKHVVFCLLGAGIMATRIYDYLATRNFRMKAGEKAHLLPEGQGFSLILFLITVYIIYALYVSFYRRVNLFPTKKGMSFREFIPYAYLGYKDKWRALLWKIPDSFSRFNSFFGPILAWSLFWAGMVTTAMWLLINNTKWYYPDYHNPLVIYLIMLAGVLLVSTLHFTNLYRQYKKTWPEKTATGKR